MTTTPLVAQLAARIADFIRDGQLAAGERLVERRIAEQLRVSRSPVRAALSLLEREGLVEAGEAGGYVVAGSDAIREVPLGIAPPDEDEADYRRIADDCVGGRLPDRVTENELLRRYGLTPGRLRRILRRMAREGWIERLPGRGWEFLPILTSPSAYEDSYRFRLLIEPAALLEPHFELDRPSLERRRAQQRWLAEGGIRQVSDAMLFELNSGMHQSLIECSRNGFFIDALKRVDRLRRLIDYRQVLDRGVAARRCREHVELLDLVLAGRRQEASEFLKAHLEELAGLKVCTRDGRGGEKAEIAAG